MRIQSDDRLETARRPASANTFQLSRRQVLRLSARRGYDSSAYNFAKVSAVMCRSHARPWNGSSVLYARRSCTQARIQLSGTCDPTLIADPHANRKIFVETPRRCATAYACTKNVRSDPHAFSPDVAGRHRDAWVVMDRTSAHAHILTPVGIA